MEITKSFQELSKNAVCYFLDYKIVSKSTVYEITKKFDPTKIKGLNFFVIHTCLRLEIYSFDGELDTKLPELARLTGKMAIRRLISLMCGTQSEIIGENEILDQVQKGIAKSLNNNLIDKENFSNLLEIIKYSEFLRSKHGINCGENYSSVGARIFSKFIKQDGKVLSVIGDGYMAEFFFKSLEHRANSQIYWVNRDIKKAEELHKNLKFLDKYKISHVLLSDCVDVLKKSDFIFAALKNTGGLFSDYTFGYPKAIVDVSYPSLFSENCNENFYSINNTFFEKYVKNPVKKSALLSCEKEMDLLLN